MAPVKPTVPPPISLETLKNEGSAAPARVWSAPGGKDRSASAEEMNKLKSIIAEKEELSAPAPDIQNVPKPPAMSLPPAPPLSTPDYTAKKTVKEVPEDVLRRMLE